ncbi:hypothetical protein PFLA_a1310 [Pseudoalteromonas flavipulchra NCIMB 2033 = ATCC BAA-314]|nr:hypothetical protein [Pseudoalteromonas flavipulchra NCIMB 2033 = ATCC BAA-314]
MYVTSALDSVSTGIALCTCFLVLARFREHGKVALTLDV